MLDVNEGYLNISFCNIEGIVVKMVSTFAAEKLICSGVLNSNTSRCTRLQPGMDVTFSLDRLYSDIKILDVSN